MCSHLHKVSSDFVWGLVCVLWNDMKGSHPQHLELVIQQVVYEQQAVVPPPLIPSRLTLVEIQPLARQHESTRALDSDMAGKEQRKEKRKEGSAVPSTGEARG